MRLFLALTLSTVDLILVLGVSVLLVFLAIGATNWWGTLVIAVLAACYPAGMGLLGRALAKEQSGHSATRKLLTASTWLLLPAVVIAVLANVFLMMLAGALG